MTLGSQNIRRVFFILLFSLIGAQQVQAEACTERDYRGLNLSSLPLPIYQELLCQLKLIIKARTNHHSLEQFVRLSEEQIGIDKNDLNWSQPTNAIVNDLINNVISEGRVSGLATAAQNFFIGRGESNLSEEEKSIIRALTMIEIQQAGNKL